MNMKKDKRSEKKHLPTSQPLLLIIEWVLPPGKVKAEGDIQRTITNQKAPFVSDNDQEFQKNS